MWRRFDGRKGRTAEKAERAERAERRNGKLIFNDPHRQIQNQHDNGHHENC